MCNQKSIIKDHQKMSSDKLIKKGHKNFIKKFHLKSPIKKCHQKFL